MDRQKSTPNTRVLLADDHPVLLQGLTLMLDRAGFEVVAEAADGLEAVECARRCEPDIAVLDVAMPRLNGLGAAEKIGRLVPRTRTIVLSMYSEDRYVLEALRAGAKGYVCKRHCFTELEQAIRNVTNDRIHLSPGLSDHVVRAYLAEKGQCHDTLTERERQILQLVAEGYSNKQIAALLALSAKTIESHRSRIMQKLQIHDTVKLVHYAIRHGLLHIE